MVIFITGTDTNVGKTFVTAGLAVFLAKQGYKVGVFKPLQTGAIKAKDGFQCPDLEYVKSFDMNIITKSSYQFIEPVAPYIAAKINKTEISFNKINDDLCELQDICDFVIVEGAGGILTPIYADKTMADLIKFMNIPVIIVSRPDLGTINHTLLTVESTKNYNINLKGIIISKYPNNIKDLAIKTAPEIIKIFSNTPILGIIPQYEGLMTSAIFNKLIKNNVETKTIFNER